MEKFVDTLWKPWLPKSPWKLQPHPWSLSREKAKPQQKPNKVQRPSPKQRQLLWSKSLLLLASWTKQELKPYRDEEAGGTLARMARSRGGLQTPWSVSKKCLQKFCCDFEIPYLWGCTALLARQKACCFQIALRKPHPKQQKSISTNYNTFKIQATTLRTKQQTNQFKNQTNNNQFLQEFATNFSMSN